MRDEWEREEYGVLRNGMAFCKRTTYKAENTEDGVKVSARVEVALAEQEGERWQS